jgi:uncharacterized protein YdiU (UPF0061 family)
VTQSDPLVEALNGFGAAYRQALQAAMLARLGLKARSDEEDVELVNAAFRAIAGGGEALRWEPFFFDWFGGLASERRALSGPRGDLYADEPFADFRRRLEGYEMERPERLADPYFARPEPEEMLYEAVEAIWALIAQADDWGAFDAKLVAVEEARAAWGLTTGA